MKILLIGTYPIEVPLHGGQLRARAIFDCYSRHGHEVRYCGVLGAGRYEDIGEYDVTVDVSKIESTETFRISPQSAVGNQLCNDIKARNHVEQLVTDFRPDVLQFEEPYMFKGISRILQDLKWSGKIVYSCYNIEFEMVGEILTLGNNDSRETHARNTVLEMIRDEEIDLISKADFCISSTTSDECRLNELGAKSTLTVRNATHEKSPNQFNIARWKRRLASNNIEKFVLFVGSAHPPNATGFIDLIGLKLGFMPRHARIIIVGGVSTLLAPQLKSEPAHIAATFNLRAQILGVVGNHDLTSLLHLAHTITLPVTHGGGSNLKTAEAILSRKPIVATRQSFRSFEEYSTMPCVTLADTPEAFKRGLVESLEREDRSLTPESNRPSSPVTWDYTTQQLAERIDAL